MERLGRRVAQRQPLHEDRLVEARVAQLALQVRREGPADAGQPAQLDQPRLARVGGGVGVRQGLLGRARAEPVVEPLLAQVVARAQVAVPGLVGREACHERRGRVEQVAEVDEVVAAVAVGHRAQRRGALREGRCGAGGGDQKREGRAHARALQWSARRAYQRSARAARRRRSRRAAWRSSAGGGSARRGCCIVAQVDAAPDAQDRRESRRQGERAAANAPPRPLLRRAARRAEAGRVLAAAGALPAGRAPARPHARACPTSASCSTATTASTRHEERAAGGNGRRPPRGGPHSDRFGPAGGTCLTSLGSRRGADAGPATGRALPAGSWRRRELRRSRSDLADCSAPPSLPREDLVVRHMRELAEELASSGERSETQRMSRHWLDRSTRPRELAGTQPTPSVESPVLRGSRECTARPFCALSGATADERARGGAQASPRTGHHALLVRASRWRSSPSARGFADQSHLCRTLRAAMARAPRGPLSRAARRAAASCVQEPPPDPAVVSRARVPRPPSAASLPTRDRPMSTFAPGSGSRLALPCRTCPGNPRPPRCGCVRAGQAPADPAAGDAHGCECPSGLGSSGLHWSRLPSPAAAGWDEALLEEARLYAESIGSHAVMIVDRGRVVGSGAPPMKSSSSNRFARACRRAPRYSRSRTTDCRSTPRSPT